MKGLIFGHRQLTEKDNIIASLEDDKERLQEELQKLRVLNENISFELTELRKYNQELIITNEQS